MFGRKGPKHLPPKCVKSNVQLGGTSAPVVQAGPGLLSEGRSEEFLGRDGKPEYRMSIVCGVRVHVHTNSHIQHGGVGVHTQVEALLRACVPTSAWKCDSKYVHRLTKHMNLYTKIKAHTGELVPAEMTVHYAKLPPQLPVDRQSHVLCMFPHKHT